MTKARDLANIISGGFTIDDLPTITNAKLQNSSITLNGSAVNLGGTATIDAGGKNAQSLTSLSISSSENAYMAGIVTIPNSTTITIPNGSTLVVI